MSVEDPQKNNPLHGLKLEALLSDLVDQYGWPILAEYTRIKCFEKNPSMVSSIKFLRKNLWAQEKLEAFYLYKFKSLPRPTDSEYELPPRQRTIPSGLEPRPPVKLELGGAKPVVDKGPAHNRKFSRNSNDRYSQKTRQSNNDRSSAKGKPADPWANFNAKKD